MKRFFFYLSLLFFSCSNVLANTADSVKIEKIKIDFSGFFRGDYWYDSRQVVDAVDGILLLYPKKPELDANGDDIQAAPNINALAMATRIRTNITMPYLLKAKSTIVLEGDFTGINSISGSNSLVSIRLRHAYTKLQWEKSSLLFGLTWHPMFVTDVFPSVISLNTGAPFQSFNRSPQLTFKQKISEGLSLSLSLVYQSDSRSLGPSDASSTYLRNGLKPNINTNLQLTKDAFTIGGSFDYKTLRPRLFTTSIKTPTLKYVTNERISSYSGMLYMKYQTTKLAVRVKGILGQNLYEHLLLGGYAVSSLDSLTGKENYTPTNHLFMFGNITYGEKYQLGFFFGYAKNLGTTDNFVKDKYYSRGMDIDYMYRFSPSFSYIKDKFQISTEFEYTASAYGTIDNNNKGEILNSKITSNYRLLIVVQYSF
jgi:hypothetical protein